MITPYPVLRLFFFFFFFNDTATTEIYTLSLHDALPICVSRGEHRLFRERGQLQGPGRTRGGEPEMPRQVCDIRLQDRKSTRLNSSHGYISYAVFCLKKKKKKVNGDRFAAMSITALVLLT